MGRSEHRRFCVFFWYPAQHGQEETLEMLDLDLDKPEAVALWRKHYTGARCKVFLCSHAEFRRILGRGPEAYVTPV